LRAWSILKGVRRIYGVLENEGEIKRPEPGGIPNADLRSCLKYLSNLIGSVQNDGHVKLKRPID